MTPLKPIFMLRFLALSIVTLLLMSSLACKKKAEPKYDTSKGTYFSIRDFARDQWSTFGGQPFVINQFTTLNGKRDSVLISALELKWSAVFKTFFETDISEPKFLDRYQFDNFLEETTQSRTFSYTAKDPELYTQKLQITIDNFTGKIRNIYIEAQKASFWNKQTKKLLYTPVRVLQIQEHNEPLIGQSKDLIIEYKFL